MNNEEYVEKVIKDSGVGLNLGCLVFGFVDTMFGLSCFLVWISSVMIAFRTSGLLSALLTAFIAVVGQIYWLIRVFGNNFYTVLCGLVLFFAILRIAVMIIWSGWRERTENR